MPMKLLRTIRNAGHALGLLLRGEALFPDAGRLQRGE